MTSECFSCFEKTAVKLAMTNNASGGVHFNILRRFGNNPTRRPFAPLEIRRINSVAGRKLFPGANEAIPVMDGVQNNFAVMPAPTD